MNNFEENSEYLKFLISHMCDSSIEFYNNLKNFIINLDNNPHEIANGYCNFFRENIEYISEFVRTKYEVEKFSNKAILYDLEEE